mmetsp:Transcript_52649/g.111825  ORF Transcript_52649/g.111825 Transcript_52649/m.111825 type:complete len:476 (+) Transcript_52649:64-1491(+)
MSEIASFLWELKTALDSCQRQVGSLAEELSAQQIEFGNYRRNTEAKLLDSEAKLSEMRRHQKTLAREVLLLRLRFEGENEERTLVAPNDKLMEGPNMSTEDDAATPVSIKTEILVCDEKNESPGRSIGENHAMMTAAPVNMEVGKRTDEQQHSRSSTGASSQTNERGSNTSKNSSESGSRASKDRVIEQRLFLLQHASRCTAPEGTCKVSRHCTETKAVWNHIVSTGCNDPNCAVKHCVSSRYVLSRCRPCKRPEKLKIPNRGEEEEDATPNSIKAKTMMDDGIHRTKSSDHSMEEDQPKDVLPTSACSGIKTETPEEAQLYPDLTGMAGQTRGRDSAAQGSDSSKSLSGSAIGDPKDRVMQQRMFLLRHASRCTAPEGTCKVSRHCAETKAVWNHIVSTGCNDPNCGVKHCVSSRYVIAHIQRFKQPPLSKSLSKRAICDTAGRSRPRKKALVCHAASDAQLEIEEGAAAIAQI